MKTTDAIHLETKLPISDATRKRNPHLYPDVVGDDFGKIVPCTPTAPKPKRIRQSDKPLMNKLEEEFYNRLLADGHNKDGILIQAIRFKLGNGIWYKPDFIYVWGVASVAWEVKGPHAFRGGFENLKIAAHQYTQFRWLLVWKENGIWREQEVKP